MNYKGYEWEVKEADGRTETELHDVARIDEKGTILNIGTMNLHKMKSRLINVRFDGNPVVVTTEWILDLKKPVFNAMLKSIVDADMQQREEIKN